MLRTAGIDAPDPPAVRAPSDEIGRRRRRSTSGRGLHRAGHRRCWPRRPASRARRCAGPPQGRHRHAPRRARRPTDALALAQEIVGRPELRARGRVDPLRGGRRARATRSPPSSWPASTRSLAELDARRASRAAAARRQLGRRHRPPGGALRPRARAASPSTASPRPGRWPVALDLRPALRLRSEVSHGQAGGGGRGHLLRAAAPLRPARPTVATVPIGYADGVPPPAVGLAGGEVLIGGGAGRSSGSVTMDQLMVDCGDDPVEVGRRGRADRRVRATRRSPPRSGPSRLDTIAYEIVCGIGPRVPRRAS